MRRGLAVWGFRPFDVPFFDAEYITASVRCWRQGVDVYAANPCDRMGRVFDYAPLWLRLPWLGLGPQWTVPLGLSLATLWAAALAVLPVARRGWAWLVLLAAVASPVCFFAIERGNVDVLMFCLTAAALVLLRGGSGERLAGYGVIGLAGALKFYPAVLACMLVRERRAVAVPAMIALAAAGGLYMLAFHHELPRALANLPVPSPFSFSFGAELLPRGLGELMGSRHLHRWLLRLLLGVAGAAALVLARRPLFVTRLLALPPAEADCLIAGALLVCGCFLSGPSVGYRGIFLLLALPGLLRLGGGGAAALALLWLSLPMRLLVAADTPRAADLTPGFTALWLLREAIWWGVIVVLMAAAGRLLFEGRAREWRRT